MLHLTYSIPYKGEIKHLIFEKNPAYYGIGFYTDIKGIRWDLFGVSTKLVWARPVDYSSKYSTDSNSIYEEYHCEYLPYTFSVENKIKIKEDNAMT